MSIYSSYSNDHIIWEHNDIIAAALLEGGLYEGLAEKQLELFNKGSSSKFILYDERLEINYHHSKKQKGELVIKNQSGVEIKRISFCSQKGLKDLFTKYINGKRDLKKLELKHLLSSPKHLFNLMKEPGYHASAYSYAGKIYPFVAGYGAKELITATKHAQKELKPLQERAVELINYHNFNRINFLKASLQVVSTNNHSGKIIWKEEGKESLELSFETQEQKRRHVEFLLNSRRLTVKEELREMRSFGKNALESEENVVERESSVNFEVQKATGLIIHNLTHNLKVRSNIPLPEPKTYQLYLAKLILYFGNQLVTLDDKELQSLRGVYNSYGLTQQLLAQLESQYENLERMQYDFDNRVYQEQFPIAFGELFIDIERKKHGTGQVMISIAGQKEVKRINYRSEDEIPGILKAIVQPFYQKYKGTIESAIKDANSSMSDNLDSAKIIEELKTTDEKLRTLFLRNSFAQVD